MKQHFLQTIFISLSSIFLYSTPTLAELIPDNTLGRENSRVEKVNATRDNIRGGAVRGTNLFHSFREFNINSGKEVYFNNPTGVQNILTRVTGGNISNIFGTLGVNGNANLYLINPNGIVFGDEAKLDINGTFIGTTADGIKLGNKDVYSATDPENSNLLTIEPGALFVNRFNNSQKRVITNQGSLEINPDSNLILSADEINNNGSIVAPGGDIFLEAVNGDININKIDASSRTGNGGNISLFANGNIILNDNSFISSVNIPTEGDFNFAFDNQGTTKQVGINKFTANGGNINLFANSNIILNNESAILSLGLLGGSINIESKGNLVITNNTYTDNVSIGNGSLGVRGKGGDIRLKAKSIEFNGGRLGTIPFLDAEAGDIFINADSLRLVNGAQILTGTISIGKSGNITIEAKDIQIIGKSPLDNDALSAVVTISSGEGNSGNISINTDFLLVANGGGIVTMTEATGQSGNITIEAKQIEINGPNYLNNSRSIIAAESLGATNGGNVNINTDSLLLVDRSVISASVRDTCLGQGNGGNVNINSERIIANTRNNWIRANSTTGNGGNININTKVMLGYPQFLTVEASSEQAIDGTVNIEGLDDEITKGSLLTLPSALDAVAILANDPCAFKNGKIAHGSSFTIIGKGGITPNPLEYLDLTPSGIVEWSKKPEVTTKIIKRRKKINKQPRSNQISKQAVGWYRLKDGTVVLTDNPDEIRPLNVPVDYPSGCQKKRERMGQ